MTAAIVGWAHTPFGKLNGETVESLIVRVAGEALADAGIAAKDVDEIVLGHFNAGFSAQDFTASLVLQASPDLRFKPATRVENACATGSAAVHHGVRAIRAGAARIVLVVGVEQMTTTPAAEIGQYILSAPRSKMQVRGLPAHRVQQPGFVFFAREGSQIDSDAVRRQAPDDPAALQPHERIEDEQARLQLSDGLGEAPAIEIDIDTSCPVLERPLSESIRSATRPPQPVRESRSGIDVCHWITWSLCEKSCGGYGMLLARYCVRVIGNSSVPTLGRIASFPLLNRLAISVQLGCRP